MLLTYYKSFTCALQLIYLRTTSCLLSLDTGRVGDIIRLATNVRNIIVAIISNEPTHMAEDKPIRDKELTKHTTEVVDIVQTNIVMDTNETIEIL